MFNLFQAKQIPSKNQQYIWQDNCFNFFFSLMKNFDPVGSHKSTGGSSEKCLKHPWEAKQWAALQDQGRMISFIGRLKN